jgi:hypothetical protein
MSHVPVCTCTIFDLVFSILAFIACHVFYGHIQVGGGEGGRGRADGMGEGMAPYPPAHTIGIYVVVTFSVKAFQS